MIRLINPDVKNNDLFLDSFVMFIVYNSLSEKEKSNFIEYIISNDNNNLDVDKREIRKILRLKILNDII